MLNFFLFVLLAFCSGTLHMISKRKMMERIQELEADLHGFTEVISKVAEVQSKDYETFSTRFEDLDERIMELSVPVRDPDLPLERRHQVLALARQGVVLEDIVKRLKAPVGETELILKLHKYRNGLVGRSDKAREQAVRHA
jgi:predicted exporter